MWTCADPDACRGRKRPRIAEHYTVTRPDLAPTASLPAPRHSPAFLRDGTLPVFLAAFAVYCFTACRTIYTGDDGDFATAVATLGVPHPTGYPLFVLAGKLWTLLTPFLGEVAFRLNIFTALCGAAAAAVAYRFIAELLDELPWNRAFAATGALLFAFAPTLWSQSTSCEVYALNACFVGLLLLLSLRFVRTEPGDAADGILCRLALAYGFALTNHLSAALFFPAFVALVVWRKPSLFGKHVAVLLAVIGCILLPLSLYAYLPISARFSPSPVRWGQPDTLPALWQHLSGVQYRGLMFTSGEAWQTGAQRYFGGYLPAEYGVFLLAVAAFGAVVLLSRPRTRPHTILLLAIFCANVAYSAGYSISDIFVYYLPSYLAVAVFIAGGGATLIDMLRKRSRWDGATTNRYGGLALPILLAGVAVHGSLHYVRSDKSENRVEADYALGVLRSCPPDALLAVRGSSVMSLWYYQHVRGERPDVLIVSQDLFPGVVVMRGWYASQLRRQDPRIDDYLPKNLLPGDYNRGTALSETLRNALRSGRAVAIVPTPDLGAVFDRYHKVRRAAGISAQEPDWWLTEKALTAGFDRVPWGLTERLYPKGETPLVAALFPEIAPLWVPGKDSIHPDYDRLRLAIARETDPAQEPIFFRIYESLVAYGKSAEAIGRPDLARAAYTEALTLYDDKATRAALGRLESPRGTSPAPAPGRDKQGEGSR